MRNGHEGYENLVSNGALWRCQKKKNERRQEYDLLLQISTARSLAPGDRSTIVCTIHRTAGHSASQTCSVCSLLTGLDRHQKKVPSVQVRPINPPGRASQAKWAEVSPQALVSLFWSIREQSFVSGWGCGDESRISLKAVIRDI